MIQKKCDLATAKPNPLHHLVWPCVAWLCFVVHVAFFNIACGKFLTVHFVRVCLLRCAAFMRNCFRTGALWYSAACELSILVRDWSEAALAEARRSCFFRTRRSWVIRSIACSTGQRRVADDIGLRMLVTWSQVLLNVSHELWNECFWAKYLSVPVGCRRNEGRVSVKSAQLVLRCTSYLKRLKIKAIFTGDMFFML